MILNVDDVYKALLYNDINVNGVFHVGAHECEELLFYNSFGVKNENMIWIDAMEHKVNEAIDRGIPNVYCALVTDKDDEDVFFNVSNNIFLLLLIIMIKMNEVFLKIVSIHR
jgi:hypothetical protein